MGPTWPLWEAKCPRVIPSAPGPPIRAWNLVGWGVRLPQQGWRVIRAYWRGRSRLTGEPLGVKAGRVGGTPDDGRSVGRRNLSCTGKPRGLREISGRTRGGDQANRLNRSGSHTGYLICPVVSWRDVIPATRAESLDRHPGGFHPQGRPQCHLGGGPGLGLSPTGRRPPRKGSIGICGAWSPEGRARAKRVHGGGDSPPGSRRPSRPLPA
jgi:hypothetical protein